MSGGGSGGGQQTSYQTSSSSSAPPSYIQPYLQGGIKDLANLYSANPKAPAYYPGQTVAPLSAPTMSAVNSAVDWARNNPLLSPATTQLADTLNGKYLDPSTNPAYRGAVSAAVDPLTTQFLHSTIPQITSQFAGSGGTGSGIQQQYVDDATKAYGTGVGNAAYTAANNFYTNARNNQLQAEALAPGINTAGIQNISTLGAAGSTLDNQAQANIYANVAKYNYNNNSQWDYINRYLASLNGGYPGGETTGSGTTMGQTYQPYNQFGSIAGGAMSGLGLGLGLYSLFSDARLKENAEPVGKLKDGQTVWSYNYKGDPTPRIGLMAQEVARTHPEAVEVDPSGFLKVDYAAATANARGLF